jgi:SAM-dependent methyltransferase
VTSGDEYFPVEELDTLAAREGAHYWHLARREVVAEALAELPAGRFLDVGCGAGAVTTSLNRRGFVVDYADVHRHALDLARRAAPPDRRFVQVDVAVAAPPKGYDGILLLDVIEHLPDDVGALRNVRSALEPGGGLLVTVPAFPVLWSPWDEREGHKRRYTRTTLPSALTAAGFSVDRVRYFFAPLFVGSAAVQLARRVVRPAPSDDLVETRASPVVNRALLAVLRWERPLVRRGWVPFGTSVLATARAV